MSTKNFYITTTLPYVNSDPHIGFAAEIIKADVLARYQAEPGAEVFFNTGTDEHGLKIYRQATDRGITPQAYCDEYSEKFAALKDALNLSYNSFIRTTDPHHIAAAQEFWQLCAANGDIYKKNYQVKYCVGCEMEKTESELIDGCCPLHPKQKLEIINEENYFFRFSKYQEPLLKFYETHPNFVVPPHRQQEIKNFVASGLQDFSISRLQDKMPWGVPVLGDESQVMYVWFDALVNYISCLGWPQDLNNFEKFWPGIQVCGKDNLRQQTAMWPAMLMSAGLPLSQQVLIFGFLTLNGQKISKSTGNIIDPYELVKKYSIDPVRYYLLKEISTFEDGDFSYEKLENLYNADLANGLGNLVARTSNLIEKNDLTIKIIENSDPEFSAALTAKMGEYNLAEALKVIWEKIKASDEYLSKTAPWKMTDREEQQKVLTIVAQNILNVALALKPFLPETAAKIITQFKAEKITKGEILFKRLEIANLETNN